MRLDCCCRFMMSILNPHNAGQSLGSVGLDNRVAVWSSITGSIRSDKGNQKGVNTMIADFGCLDLVRKSRKWK